MNTIDVNGLLQQMRAMSAQAQLPTRRPVSTTSVEGMPDFGSLLKQSIDGVSSSQNAASALSITDHGFVLSQGAVVARGSSAELLADDRMRHAYLGF